MIHTILDIAFATISILVLATLVRVVRGPTIADRLMAGELGGTLLTFLLALVGAQEASDLYLDAALIVALLAFISTVGIARFTVTRRSGP